MLMINFTQPGTIILAIVLFCLTAFLGKETKKSFVPLIMLFVFLALVIAHSVELSLCDPENALGINIYARTIVIDLAFIFISFLDYLWIDEIEAKEKNKKVLNSGIDFFWKKV